jgi:NTE family protein
MENNKNPINIKHIVISGGGTAGFSFYGAIKECHNNSIWKFENLTSMYGTSIGSIICVILCLNYDWSVLDDFLIKRPWQNVFKFNMYTIVDSFHKRGMYDSSIFENAFMPLFNGKDISINITMQEFFELTKIDLHIYASEINKYELIDFSHSTHPNWRIVDAVYCSCCLPIIFSPYILENNCYCDGGLISNYPIHCCIKNGANPEEILGIKMIVDRINQIKIDEESSIFDYVIYLFNKLLQKRIFSADSVGNNIPYEIKIESPELSIYTAYQIIISKEQRANLIDYGKKCSESMIKLIVS